MHRLDEFLLDRVYQPLIDRWQTDCIVVGRDTLLSCFIMNMAQVPLRIYLITNPALLFVSLLGHLIIGLNVLFLRTIMRSLLGRTGVNPLRIGWFFPRMVLLMILGLGNLNVLLTTNIFNFWDIVDTVLEIIRDLSLISGLYFGSCSNRPGLRQRVLGWQTV